MIIRIINALIGIIEKNMKKFIFAHILSRVELKFPINDRISYGVKNAVFWPLFLYKDTPAMPKTFGLLLRTVAEVLRAPETCRSPRAASAGSVCYRPKSASRPHLQHLNLSDLPFPYPWSRGCFSKVRVARIRVRS